MTSLSYEDIYSDFLGNMSDYQLASLNTSDAYELMTEYLQKGMRQSYVRDLFTTLTYDKTVQILSYELVDVIDEDRDKEFVLGILSKAMVVEWLKPQVRSKINVAQVFGTKESKFFSQSSHLSEIKGLLEDTRLELRKEIRDRSSLHNSYIGGV